MDLISVVVFLLIVGLVLYILSIAPIDATMKQIGRAIIIVFALIWLLGLLTGNPYVVLHR